MKITAMTVFIVVALSRPAFATNFYTSSTGSDSGNNCQNIASPCNLSNGFANEFSQITANHGDVLYLCAGACDGSGSATFTVFDWLDGTVYYGLSATSWSGAFSIKPYSTGGSFETLTYQPPYGCYYGPILNAVQYVILGDSTDYARHLRSDGSNCLDPGPDVADWSGFSVSTNNVPQGNHIRFVNIEITGWSGSGIAEGPNSSSNEYLNLWIHNNGRRNGHGLYLCGDHQLVQGGDISYQQTVKGQGTGIQTFCDPDGVNDAIIEYVDIHHNNHGLAFGGPFNAGARVILRNNVIRDNLAKGVIVAGLQQRILNNTIVRNGEMAIGMWHGDSADIRNNIFYGNAEDNIVQIGGAYGWTDYNNLKGINPMFVNYWGNDFHLTAFSPSKDVGAFPYDGGSGATPPSPPTNLHVVR